MKGDFDNIPIVSLAGLAEDAAPEERAKTVAALKEALETSGFAYLADHGVSEDLVEKMRQMNMAFHDLPMEEKMALKINGFHRGYMPMSSSTIVTSSVAKVTKPNRSESLMVMHEVPEDAPYAGEPLQDAALRLHGILAWMPQHLAMLLYGLAGSTDGALTAWRQRDASDADNWVQQGWQRLAAIGCGALLIDEEQAPPPDIDERLRQAIGIVSRSLIILLAVLSAFTIGGWIT